MGKKNVILFMGPQASGKGTQARLYSEKHSIPTVSTGVLLRAVASSRSDLGQKLERLLNAGDLVPDDLMVSMLREHLDSMPNATIILDGFPRTLEQAQRLDEIARVTRVVHITLPIERCLSRLASRIQCERGHIYNTITVPPEQDGVCDIDGLPLKRRDDETEAAIRRRLELSQKNLDGLIELYSQRGVVVTVDGDASIEVIARQIEHYVSESS